MTAVRSFNLTLWECANLRSEADVIDVAEKMADLGLRPGVGAYTGTSEPQPVDDVRAFVPTTHRSFQSLKTHGRVDRRLLAEAWTFTGLWMRVPGAHSIVTIARREGAGDWDVSVMMLTWSHEHAKLPLEQFVNGTSDLLERIGEALYSRVRPAFGMLYGVTSSEIDLPSAVIRRDLVVGWRTWYGPAYVEKYGREVLLGLPDRVEQLDDGGVYHALDATPLQLATGDRSLYANVWPYLDQCGLEPAWPRRPRSRKGHSVARASSGPAPANGLGSTNGSEPTGNRARPAERTLDEVKAYVNQMLETALVFAGGTVHLFMLPIGWTQLTDEQRVVAFRMVLYIIQGHQQEHPTVRIEIRFDEIPPELREWLEGAYPPGGPVSYGLLTDDPSE